MAQVAREKALTKFREDKIKVLVATDVAARGIDVAGVTHVINYSCPEDEKTYIHRIGRTGRAGATGIAITFVDWADLHRWKMINKTLDLPFEEPPETYSTSEHLFHDQGIAPGTKGRIVDPAPVERSRARERSDRRPSAASGRPQPQPRRARAAAAGRRAALPRRPRRGVRRPADRPPVSAPPAAATAAVAAVPPTAPARPPSPPTVAVIRSLSAAPALDKRLNTVS